MIYNIIIAFNSSFVMLSVWIFIFLISLSFAALHCFKDWNVALRVIGFGIALVVLRLGISLLCFSMQIATSSLETVETQLTVPKIVFILLLGVSLMFPNMSLQTRKFMKSLIMGVQVRRFKLGVN